MISSLSVSFSLCVFAGVLCVATCAVSLYVCHCFSCCHSLTNKNSYIMHSPSTYISTRASATSMIDFSTVLQSSDAAADTALNVDRVVQSPQPLLQPGDSWATVATSSPVIATNNTFRCVTEYQ